ncbi:MAG: hypothetical protein ABIU63_00530 [Chitinophagaceae bacterium]
MARFTKATTALPFICLKVSFGQGQTRNDNGGCAFAFILAINNAAFEKPGVANKSPYQYSFGLRNHPQGAKGRI